MSTARSRKSTKLRIGMLAPGQSCTDFIPASRSRQSVLSAGVVLTSVVFPLPGGPKMATEVLLFAADNRSSAVTIRTGILISFTQRGGVRPRGRWIDSDGGD